MKLKTLFIFVLLQFVALTGFAAVDIQHWQTKAGANVYFVENHDLPILDLAVSFNAGGIQAPADKMGLAGVTRHMMQLGAAGMNEETITNTFADIGARTGGGAGDDNASYSLRTLTSEQDKALAMMNKILHQPDFPEQILAREKKRIIASIKQSATQPGSIAGKAFSKAMYGDHPYGRYSTVESVNSLTVQDLRDFYQQHYVAQGAVIALIGDVSVERAHLIAESITQGLPVRDADQPVSVLPTVKALEKASIQRIAHPALQAHIMIGQPGIKRTDPDYFALYVGNYILGGGGFVSRLTEEVREKKGLAYSVYSYFSPMVEQGPFKIGLQTKKENVDAALKIVNETLTTFVDQGITQKELDAAKSNIIGGFPMRIDSNKKILRYLSAIGFYQLPLTYLADFNQKIDQLTVAQINDAFKRHIKPEKFVTVVVGVE